MFKDEVKEIAETVKFLKESLQVTEAGVLSDEESETLDERKIEALEYLLDLDESIDNARGRDCSQTLVGGPDAKKGPLKFLTPCKGGHEKKLQIFQ